MGLERFSLAGRTALVTGGSRGIGEAIACELASVGAAVVPAARSMDDLAETVDRITDAGGEAVAASLDVTDEESVAAAFDRAEDAFDTVDVLVNNAGMNPFFGDARNLDVETWNRIVDVNATGAFRCAREFARRLDPDDGTGSVLNVSSIGGVVGLPYQAPYTTAKHGVAGLTRSLAAEWAPDVRVNALAPGYVKTELTAGVRQNERIHEEILSEIPAGRFADPEEVSAAAVYLVSDAASYVTGEVHLVDGGYAST